MPYIVVSPLSRIAHTATRFGALDMVTLITGDTSVDLPEQISESRYLRLGFNDIVEVRDGLVPPGENHVTALLEFAERWTRETPLLIHCYAGISRSTAAAYIVAAALNPQLDELLLAQRLRQQSPSATPNIRLIALADAILARNGRMVAAIQSIGRGADAFEGEPFMLCLEG